MSRKYRQRGYQDDDHRPRAREGVSRPVERREGPGGRGLGAPMVVKFNCARCGSSAKLPVSADAICSTCNSALHACTTCRHFDTSASNECRQGVAIRIVAKAAANDCADFSPRVAHVFEEDSRRDKADAKSAFEALFE